MRNWKYGVIIVLLIILMGVIIFSMRAKPQKKAVSQPSGLANDPPISEVVKDSSPKQVEAPTNSAPVYLTQEQQDSRQHKWGKPNLPEVDAACLHGAEAKVTLRVIDSGGKPVPEAEVKVAFSPRDPNEAGKNITGLTDKEGLFVATGKTTYDVSYSASKTNYYLTVRKFPFYWQGTACAKDGRWQPWNPTLEVVLKEKRKPIPMYTKRVESKIPVRDLPIGYDFLKGDWVQPYGQGKDADITLTYSETPRTNTLRRYDLIIAFTNQMDGAYLMKKDNYSQFASAHEADAKGYQSGLAFVYERTDNKIIQDKRITEDDMIVFRVRTKTDESGNITEAYYGKVYGPCKFADGPQRFIRLSYYFNPTPNDRNLEFDGKNNLFDPDRKDSWPRNP